MFKLDKNNTGSTGEFTMIEKGEYEVFPIAFEVTQSQSGNQMATFNYVIRDDVEQEFKGREIRYDRFVATEGAMWRINQASDAAKLDMDKEYESLEAWAKDFKNKAVRVYVDHREFNGKTYPEVKSFKESEVGGERKETESSNDPFEVNSENLPF